MGLFPPLSHCAAPGLEIEMSSNVVKDSTTLVTPISEVKDPVTNSLMCSPDDLPLWTLLDPEFGVPGDVIFRIEDIGGVVSGSVWAHRNILALRSPVFKEMFYPQVEKETITVMKTEIQMVKSASVKTFKKMLDHIYGKKIDWSDCSVVEVFQVMHLAFKYQLNGLQTKVEYIYWW